MKPWRLLAIVTLTATLHSAQVSAEVPPSWGPPEGKEHAFDTVATFLDGIIAKDAKALTEALRFDDSHVYLQQIGPADAKGAKKCAKLVKVKKRKSFKSATSKCLLNPHLIGAINHTLDNGGTASKMQYFEFAADLNAAHPENPVVVAASKHLQGLGDEHGFVLLVGVANGDGSATYDLLLAISQEQNTSDRAVGAIFGTTAAAPAGKPAW